MKKIMMLIMMMAISTSVFAMGGKPKDDFWSDLKKINDQCYALAGPTTGTGAQGQTWTSIFNGCYYPKRKAAGCARNLPAECNGNNTW